MGRHRAMRGWARRVLVAAVFATAGPISCDPAAEQSGLVASDEATSVVGEEGGGMEPEEIERILRSLPDDGSQDDATAERLRDESQGSARTLVEIWRGPDARLADRAGRVLYALEDPVIVPLLEPPPPGSPDALARSLQLAVVTELGLRERVIRALDAALDDKRLIEAPPRLAPAEETIPSQRVCDRAYLLMREIVHFGEDEVERAAGADNFVHLPKDVRDAQIARARRTGTWQRLVVGEEVEGYVAPDTPPSSGLPPRR